MRSVTCSEGVIMHVREDVRGKARHAGQAMGTCKYRGLAESVKFVSERECCRNPWSTLRPLDGTTIDAWSNGTCCAPADNDWRASTDPLCRTELHSSGCCPI